MRNIFKCAFIGLLIGAAISPAQAAKIYDDTLTLGTSSSSDKVLKLGAGALKFNVGSSLMQYSADGLNFKNIGSGGGSLGINLLQNANYDVEQGQTGYTASGGTVATVTSGSNLWNGSQTLSWTPSAGSQTLVTAQFAVGGLAGKSCMAKVSVKTAETANPYTIQAIDVSNNVLGSVTVQAGSIFTDQYATFICPTSSTATIALRINTPASAPTNTIYLDDFQLGTNSYLANVSQAVLFGGAKWPITTSCIWDQTAGSSFVSYAAIAACTSPSGTNLYGNASAPATKIPAVTFANLPPGDYFIVANGTFVKNSSTSGRCTWAISDGTNTSSGGGQYTTTSTAASSTITGRFNYSTAQSNITFDIRASGSTTCDIFADANNQNLEFLVYRYPTSADTVFRPDSTPASWSGYHDNTCLWTTTSATVVDPTADTSCNLVQRTNRNFGTVSPLGGTNTLPGITFTPPRIGRYFVKASFSGRNSASAGASIYKLVDGSGNQIDLAKTDGPGINFDFATSVSGVLDATSISPTTVKIQMASNGTNTVSINAPSQSVEWSIVELDAPMPAPVYQGFVGSNTSGQERVERATIANNGTCTITSQSGSWISGTSHPATGECALTFAAGMFSAAPSCTCSGRLSGAFCYNVTPATTSGVTTDTRSVSPTPTVADFDMAYDIICMGPH